MVDYDALQTIPEERLLVAGAQYQQLYTAEELQEAWQHISPQGAAFLKYRILTTTDAEARHMMGKRRTDGSQRTCGCGKHEPGWIDFRETTLADYKHSPWFMMLYNALRTQPVMHAAVRLQGLAPAAVAAYEKILDPNNEDPNLKPSTIRLAAKDVLEANSLKQTEGVNVRHNALLSAQAAQDSVQYRMALERYQRGLQISPVQRQLLAAGGVEMEEPTGTVTVIGPDRSERTLDGEDVQVVWEDAGDENEAYLPD